MSEPILLDTTIHEPPYATAGEVEMLLFMLERARAQFAWKCGGLDAASLNRPFPPSAMTLGGLIKHVAFCEDRRVSEFVTGTPMVGPWRREDFDADPEWDWHSAAHDTPEELYTLSQRVVEHSRTAWADVLAEGDLGQPSKFTTPSGESVNLRRALVDQIEHYLRHTGHADLFREAIDGLVGEDPPQR
jgi:hypothetical protein